ncbi:UDP-glucose 4-epimerase GalE [bacterium]|nr:UDP-glucose 4-epimerase GalE [bacterium]
MKVLVTGGAGYIGSTVCSALKDGGHTPVILDSLVTGQEVFTQGHIFYKGDIADQELVTRVLNEHKDIRLVVHCAALIVVPESMEKPYEYYRENVSKSIELFKSLVDHKIEGVVFSSSASIYDVVERFKVSEASPLKPQSPYARTKYMMEMVLRDFASAYGMKAIALRYFNPIGADPKLRSGIHVREPSHVVGKLVDCARGKIKKFEVTGVNWPTRDGSGIRDYIHVWDLARAHVAALENFADVFASSEHAGADNYQVINLGTGHGITVKELLTAFERVFGATLNKGEAPPRPGDNAGSYASCEKAAALLGWHAEKTIEDGIRDALRWGAMRHSVLGYD